VVFINYLLLIANNVPIYNFT